MALVGGFTANYSRQIPIGIWDTASTLCGMFFFIAAVAAMFLCCFFIGAVIAKIFVSLG